MNLPPGVASAGNPIAAVIRPETQALPDGTPLKGILEYASVDVLCGRGGGTNHHVGNSHWRALVAANKRLYITLPKKQKILVAKSIVHAIRSQKPPGRFLQKDTTTNLWDDIGDLKATEKTSQALREGAPDIRSKLEEERRVTAQAVQNNGSGGASRPGVLLPNGLISLEYEGVDGTDGDAGGRSVREGSVDINRAAGIAVQRQAAAHATFPNQQLLGAMNGMPFNMGMVKAFQQFQAGMMPGAPGIAPILMHPLMRGFGNTNAAGVDGNVAAAVPSTFHSNVKPEATGNDQLMSFEQFKQLQQTQPQQQQHATGEKKIDMACASTEGLKLTENKPSDDAAITQQSRATGESSGGGARALFDPFLYGISGQLPPLGRGSSGGSGDSNGPPKMTPEMAMEILMGDEAQRARESAAIAEARLQNLHHLQHLQHQASLSGAGGLQPSNVDRGDKAGLLMPDLFRCLSIPMPSNAGGDSSLTNDVIKDMIRAQQLQRQRQLHREQYHQPMMQSAESIGFQQQLNNIFDSRNESFGPLPLQAGVSSALTELKMAQFMRQRSQMGGADKFFMPTTGESEALPTTDTTRQSSLDFLARAAGMLTRKEGKTLEPGTNDTDLLNDDDDSDDEGNRTLSQQHVKDKMMTQSDHPVTTAVAGRRPSAEAALYKEIQLFQMMLDAKNETLRATRMGPPPPQTANAAWASTLLQGRGMADWASIKKTPVLLGKNDNSLIDSDEDTKAAAAMPKRKIDGSASTSGGSLPKKKRTRTQPELEQDSRDTSDSSKGLTSNLDRYKRKPLDLPSQAPEGSILGNGLAPPGVSFSQDTREALPLSETVFDRGHSLASEISLDQGQNLTLEGDDGQFDDPDDEE